MYAHWDFARINGIGWRWAGVIWIYSIITYIPLDILKFLIRMGLTGSAWDNMLQNKVLNNYQLFLFYLYVCSLCCINHHILSLWCCRLHSQQRKTTVKERGRLNGPWLNVQCTALTLKTPTRTTTTMSSLKLLNRLRDVLRQLGQY